MFLAALSRYEVTMFQPTRPLLRWSSVPNLRASAYGCSYVDDTVTPNPRWLVTAAIAETSSSGSLTGTCTPSVTAASALPW